MNLASLACRALLLGFCTLPSLDGFAAEPGAGETVRPNVLIFLTDDESWQERSIYGWSKIPTPNFDRVAQQGVLFTRAYTTAPSCAPSRASLLTGRNFWELEEGAFIQAWLPAKFRTLPELMEAGGYWAGYTGKGWGPGVIPPESGRTRNPAGNVYNSIHNKIREEGMSDIDYAANFEQFLAKRPAGKPFWFWLGSMEPHTPCGRTNWQRLQQEHGLGLADIKVPDFLPDTPGVRRTRANMLYEVCRTDVTLGKVLKILEQRGELDNTILIFSSDNGTQVYRSKANLYDWGLHEPMAIMWPARVKPGRRVEDFVSFADVAPTILEAAGLPVPPEMSGRSFLKLLLSSASGRLDPSRDSITGGLEWHGEKSPCSFAGRMIRDERYQYIVNYSSSPRRRLDPAKILPDSQYERTAETGSEADLITKHPEHPAVKKFIPLFVSPRPAEEFYDLQTDPWQLHNLADSPEHAADKARLKAKLAAYQRQTGDPRATGDMTVFNRTRAYVENRKYGKGGYATRAEE